MRRILYIDPFSFEGHVNFNKIHIEALRRYGFRLEFVFKEGYGKLLGEEDVVYEYPERLYNHDSGNKWRLSQYRILRDIMQHVDLESYGRIFLSAYETFSVLLTGFPMSYLVNHDNIQNNVIKIWGLRALAKKQHVHIALLRQSLGCLKAHGCVESYFVNHGLIESYPDEPRDGGNQITVFSPSAESSDELFINEMILDDSLNEILESKNVRISIRSNNLHSDRKNIEILSRRLSDDEYRKKFMASDYILIAYPEAFKYRVSGVLMEALACGKRILVRDIEAMREFRNLIGADNYFRDIRELSQCIGRLEARPENVAGDQRDLRLALSPDYSFVQLT